MTAAELPAPQTGVLQGWLACALVVLATAALSLAIQLPNFLHQDVAFLTWAADRVMHGEVFGRDIYEINPPLSFMIYVPAALMAQLIGFDAAIRLWVVFLASLSIVCLWNTADRSIRLPAIVALGLFFALFMPAEFGQRDQLTLLLCAAYASGHSERRGQALLNGVMAGIGFAMKPYFLVPLLLIFATRRKIRTEEWAIAATGLLYGASLPLFFQPYLFELLPKQVDVYWLINGPITTIFYKLAIVPLCLAVFYVVAAPQPAVRGFAAAALGFAIAVALHRKGYQYNFLPAFGFLVIYTVAMLWNARRLARWLAVYFLVAEIGGLLMFADVSIFLFRLRREIVPPLVAEADASASFTFLADSNLGAFPTAILTRAPFLGISPSNNFMTAVTGFESGILPGDGSLAARNALDQALRELRRKPDLVVVNTDWTSQAALDQPLDSRFDGLAWFNRDPAFRALWADYALTGHFKTFDFYRRK